MQYYSKKGSKDTFTLIKKDEGERYDYYWMVGEVTDVRVYGTKAFKETFTEKESNGRN